MIPKKCDEPTVPCVFLAPIDTVSVDSTLIETWEAFGKIMIEIRYSKCGEMSANHRKSGPRGGYITILHTSIKQLILIQSNRALFHHYNQFQQILCGILDFISMCRLYSLVSVIHMAIILCSPFLRANCRPNCLPIPSRLEPYMMVHVCVCPVTTWA